MLIVPKNRIAVVPIYNRKQTESGLHLVDSFENKKKVPYFAVIDNVDQSKVYFENEDHEMAVMFSRKLFREKFIPNGVVKKFRDESDTLDTDARANQGIVKYIGEGVNDYEKGIINVRVGDYILFSRYVGSIIHMEGEGPLVIMQSKFIEGIVQIDEYMQIPGLFFRTRDKQYAPITFEMAMNMIAKAFTLHGKTIPVNDQKPKLEEYNS